MKPICTPIWIQVSLSSLHFAGAIAMESGFVGSGSVWLEWLVCRTLGAFTGEVRKGRSAWTGGLYPSGLCWSELSSVRWICSVNLAESERGKDLILKDRVNILIMKSSPSLTLTNHWQTEHSRDPLSKRVQDWRVGSNLPLLAGWLSLPSLGLRPRWTKQPCKTVDLAAVRFGNLAQNR